MEDKKYLDEEGLRLYTELLLEKMKSDNKKIMDQIGDSIDSAFEWGELGD